VTANALAEEKQRCLESGMDSCLSKPVTLDVLKQTLSIYAERVRKRGYKKGPRGPFYLPGGARLRGPTGVGRVARAPPGIYSGINPCPLRSA
jgi:DNA-binding response OmpR family regulator